MKEKIDIPPCQSTILNVPLLYQTLYAHAEAYAANLNALLVSQIYIFSSVPLIDVVEVFNQKPSVGWHF
jgi:hypothetical protein